MDPKDLEKQLKVVQDTVKALNESLSAKFAADKVVRAKEIDDFQNKIIAQIHPPKRKMQWAIDKTEGNDAKKLFLGQFLKAIAPGNEQIRDEEVRAHIKTTLTAGTAATAGYTVPVEYSNEIIKLETAESIIRRLGRIFPMGTLTRYLPKQLTSVSVTWTAEGVAATETNPTFGRLTQTAKKVAALVKMTDELLADNNVGIDNFIMQLVAEAIGTEEDRIAFVGDVSGLSDPFNGILYASGVNSVSMAGANLTADDIIDLIMTLNAKYRVGSTLITSTDGLKAIMKLKDKDDRPLWLAPTQSLGATIYGYPYEICDQILSTYGTGAQTALLFGNFKKHFFVSDRGGYEVKVSDSASDGSGYAFVEDELWYRFKRRMSLDVANAAAFAKMFIA